MIPFGLEALMTVSLPIGRRTTNCLVPGASAVYLFNEGAGQVLTDRSGNGYHGTLGAAGAAPTWTATGLSNGSDDYTDCGVVPYRNTALSAFIVCKGAAQNGAHIFGRYDTGANARCWAISTGDTATADQFLATVSDSGVLTGHARQYISAATVFGDQLFHEIGFTFDAGVLLLYANGAPDATAGSNFNEAITAVYNPATTHTTLGSRLNSGATAGNFVGDLVLAIVYPFALTAAQVAQNHAWIKAYTDRRGVAPPL